jgi:hypothetical protein
MFPGFAPTTRPAAAVRDTALTLAWDGRALSPERLRIPRGMSVTLNVASTSSTYDGHLAIPSYGPGAPFVPLVPSSSRGGTFVTARPGEGFAIEVDGKAVGRLDVLGEHLEEDRQ